MDTYGEDLAEHERQINENLDILIEAMSMGQSVQYMGDDVRFEGMDELDWQELLEAALIRLAKAGG